MYRHKTRTATSSVMPCSIVWYLDISDSPFIISILFTRYIIHEIWQDYKCSQVESIVSYHMECIEWARRSMDNGIPTGLQHLYFSLIVGRLFVRASGAICLETRAWWRWMLNAMSKLKISYQSRNLCYTGSTRIEYAFNVHFHVTASP